MTRTEPSASSAAEPDQAGTHDPLDAAAFAKLRALLGDAKVEFLLSKLSSHLATVVTEMALGSGDREQLARTAHAAVSSAGVLGFKTFARLCADLEAACATDRDLSELKLRVLAERRHIGERMARLAVDGLDAAGAGGASFAARENRS